MVKYLINEQYDVQEPETTKGYGRGERREDYADAWKETGKVVLIGLDGSGKRALAQLLADKTGLPVISPADGDQAVEVMGGSGAIITLDDQVVEAEAVQSGLHGSGKVFYLMADSNTLSAKVAERDGIEDREELWRSLSARLALMEPIFYSGLHFILQAAGSAEEMLPDALEKINY